MTDKDERVKHSDVTSNQEYTSSPKWNKQSREWAALVDKHKNSLTDDKARIDRNSKAVNYYNNSNFVMRSTISDTKSLDELIANQIVKGIDGFKLSSFYIQMVLSSPIPTLIKQMFEGAVLKIYHDGQIIEQSQEMAQLIQSLVRLRSQIASIKEELKDSWKDNAMAASLALEQERAEKDALSLQGKEKEILELFAEYVKRIKACERILMQLDEALKPYFEARQRAFDEIIQNEMLRDDDFVRVCQNANVSIMRPRTWRHMCSVMNAPVPTKGPAKEDYIKHLEEIHVRQTEEVMFTLEKKFGPRDAEDVESEFNIAICGLDAMHCGVEKPLDKEMVEQMIEKGYLGKLMSLRNDNIREYERKVADALKDIPADDLEKAFGETDIDEIIELIYDNGYETKLTALIAQNQANIREMIPDLRHAIEDTTTIIDEAHGMATELQQSLGIEPGGPTIPSTPSPTSGASGDD